MGHKTQNAAPVSGLAHPRSRRTTTLAGASLALAVAAALVLGGTDLSFAHDQVLTTTPSSDQSVEIMPDRISMTFTAELLEFGAQVLVVDANGSNWALGEAAIAGATLTHEVRTDAPVGNYQARWQVVSSDGHPIAGTFSFSVGDATALPKPSLEVAPQPGIETPADTPHAAHPEVPPVLWIALVGAAVGGVLYTALVFTLRSRKRRAFPGDRTADHPTNDAVKAPQ